MDLPGPIVSPYGTVCIAIISSSMLSVILVPPDHLNELKRVWVTG